MAQRRYKLILSMLIVTIMAIIPKTIAATLQEPPLPINSETEISFSSTNLYSQEQKRIEQILSDFRGFKANIYNGYIDKQTLQVKYPNIREASHLIAYMIWSIETDGKNLDPLILSGKVFPFRATPATSFERSVMIRYAKGAFEAKPNTKPEDYYDKDAPSGHYQTLQYIQRATRHDLNPKYLTIENASQNAVGAGFEGKKLAFGLYQTTWSPHTSQGQLNIQKIKERKHYLQTYLEVWNICKEDTGYKKEEICFTGKLLTYLNEIEKTRPYLEIYKDVWNPEQEEPDPGMADWRESTEYYFASQLFRDLNKYITRYNKDIEIGKKFLEINALTPTQEIENLMKERNFNKTFYTIQLKERKFNIAVYFTNIFYGESELFSTEDEAIRLATALIHIHNLGTLTIHQTRRTTSSSRRFHYNKDEDKLNLHCLNILFKVFKKHPTWNSLIIGNITYHEGDERFLVEFEKELKGENPAKQFFISELRSMSTP